MATFAPRYRRSRRAAYEYHPTPPEGTRALLEAETFDGPIWEPACGEGAISDELIAAGYDVISSDLIERGYGRGGIDFLKATKMPGNAKHIITNPPYGTHGLGDAFVRKALILTRETGGSVAMLLNLASLAHPSRHPRWRNSPPAAIYALDELICYPYGDPAQATYRTAKHRYCWAVWKHGHQGPPIFWWLDASKLKAGQPAG